MKTLTLIGFLLVSTTCFAQKEIELLDSIPKVNGSYEYTEIVKVDSSFKKDDLYKNAKLYFVNSYKSANDVIQYDEKLEGRIIGKGFFGSGRKVGGMKRLSIYFSKSEKEERSVPYSSKGSPESFNFSIERFRRSVCAAVIEEV